MCSIDIPAPKIPFMNQETWTIWICSFNIPMAPGKTRSIVCSARNFFQFTVPGPEWWQIVPRWYEHWSSNKVYDGDMIVLQGQEKAFGAGGNFAETSKNYTKLTFTPTQADRFVLAFRNWLRKHGKNQPEWFPEVDQSQPLPSTVLGKRVMLDRYEQHTLKCASCRKAQENFQLAQKILWGATVVFAAGAGVPPDMSLRFILAAAAVVSAGAAYLLKEGEKNFIFKDYVHAKID
jgi:pheophorbide a oxygenase